MNAMVLCAGHGTRLRPLTDTIPKPLVRVAGRVLLEDVLHHLALNGVGKAVVNGSWLSGSVRNFLDDTVLPLETVFQYEEEPLGTAGAVRRALPLLGERFLVVYGDNLTRQPVAPLLRMHEKLSAEVTIALAPTGEPSSKGIVLTAPDGRITEFREKPPDEIASSNLANSGIYVCESSVVNTLEDGDTADFGLDVFPGMLEHDRVMGAELPGGYTRDIGTLESYLIACHDLLSGRLRDPSRLVLHDDGILVENGQDLDEIDITGTLWIEDGALVQRGCAVSNCVVLSGAVVESGSSLRNTLVLPGSVVRAGTDFSDKYLSVV